MGRGLSDLQRFILKRAAESGGARRGDVLCDYFGWRTQGERPTGRYAWIGEQNFSPSQIGTKKYRSDSASLSRAQRRLRERGLVNDGGCVLVLTDAGKELVRSWGIEPVPPPDPGPGLEELAARLRAIG
jgi:hypothetical protein